MLRTVWFSWNCFGVPKYPLHFFLLPKNTTCLTTGSLMLGQRRRRRDNFQTALCQNLVFILENASGICKKILSMHEVHTFCGKIQAHRNKGVDWYYIIHHPANKGHSPNAVSMLAYRLRRWPNIETASGECPLFAG